MPSSGSSPLPRRPSPAMGRDHPSPSPIRALLPRRGRRGQARAGRRCAAVARTRRGRVRQAGRRAAPGDHVAGRAAERHAAGRRRRAAREPGLRAPAGLPRNGPGRRRRDVRLDAPGRDRRAGQDHRLRVGVAVHARGSAAEPGRRRRRNQQRRHQSRHVRARCDQRRPQRHRHHRDRTRRADQRIVVQRPVVVSGDQGRGGQAAVPATSSCSRSTGLVRPRRTRCRASLDSSRSSGGRTTSRRSGMPFAKGIIVVEAAGNGTQNLDAADLLTRRRPGFPSSWRNPFNPGNPSSGAVVVGAGAPPPGTHGRDNGPDRSRLDFSNFGARVDVQGWGREVTSTGYGDLQGGSNQDLWYTDQFSGTSSASPVVVGTLAATQGALRSRGHRVLTSEGRTAAPAVVRVAADRRPRPAGEPAHREAAEPPRAHSERGEVQVAQRRLRRRRPGRVPDDEPMGHRHPRAGRHDDGRADHASQRDQLRRLAPQHRGQPLRPARRLRRRWPRRDRWSSVRGASESSSSPVPRWRPR